MIPAMIPATMPPSPPALASAARRAETARPARRRAVAALFGGLLVGLASAALVTPADAGHRRDRVFVGSFVVVQSWARPAPWSGTPGGGWGPGWWVPAVYGKAVRTTVYPYGPRGDGKRGYWYPHLVQGRCGCAADGLCC